MLKDVDQNYKKKILQYTDQGSGSIASALEKSFPKYLNMIIYSLCLRVVSIVLGNFITSVWIHEDSREIDKNMIVYVTFVLSCVFITHHQDPNI